MKYRYLGNSSLQVSEIGFGCMSLGTDNDSNSRLLNQAVDMGINFFDTADLYDHGRNEETLGMALREKRKEVILATKVGNQWRADLSGWDWNPGKSYILKAVRESLRRLNTDYIDLYQLHGGMIEDPLDETIDAFEILKKEGIIRFYGISSIRPNVIREYARRSNMVSVMTQYSLLDRRPEESTFQLLGARGIGVLARGSLAQGLLVDKPAAGYLGQDVEKVKEAALAIQGLARIDRNNTGTALQYVFHEPALTSAVVGIRTTGQLEDAVRAVSSPPLTDAEFQTLNRAAPPLVYEKHR
jgi:aryl-alcohol dehydrogenase-like predicted oxidoreductase